VRQPEVARLARLALAVVLALPLLDAGRSMLVASLFLLEFLSGGVVGPLTRVTTTPVRTTLGVPHVAVDRYADSSRAIATPLVLVHGLAPDGKDDARVGAAATLLARAGFEVLVPTIPGLTEWRLRPGDREPVIATLATRSAPTVVIGVSVGAGVAMLAAADPRVRDRVALVLSLGGYASAIDLVRYYLTGEFEGHGVRGRHVHDPELVRRFIDANTDLIDASARAALAAKNPDDVSRALTALSPDLVRLLDALSPVRVLREIRAPLIFVHGRDDIAVPYTESLALFDARHERARLVLVGIVGHVEAAPTVKIFTSARDLIALWSVVYALVSLA
jgi:pimeloyl-ACP methyl ester carboxylesterase